MKNSKTLYILLLALVVVAVIIILNIISFSQIEKILIVQLKEKQSTETQTATFQIESHIIQVKDELVILSKFPIMKTLDVNQCSGDMKIIHEKIEGKIDSLLRVDSEGNIIECSSPKFSDYVGLNIENKDYFKIPKEKNEPYITGLVRQGAMQQVIVSAPLFETVEYTPYPNFMGKFEGVIMSIIELDQLYNTYIHSYVQDGRNYFLLVNLDTKETLLKSEVISNYSQIKEYMPELSDGYSEINDFDGFGETIVTSSDLVLGSEIWRLIILTPIDNIDTNIKSVQNRHIFGLGFVIIVVILIFFFIISLYKSKVETQTKLEKAKVTLKNLGIKIEFEKDKFTQADLSLETKKVYLVKEEDENNAYELFISSLNKGFAGLGIAREDPAKIRKKYNLKKTSFVWLTNNKIEGVPCETDINVLYTLIKEFIKNSKKSVILMDRLDYVITENKFEDVIKTIHALKDLTSLHECIIILSVNPELLDKSQLSVIEADTIDLYGKHLRKKVELSDIEMNILQFINDKNISNKLASYKDITENFKITKPTTRTKIDKLRGLGLLDVEQKGRFKSIKITSAGRRIIN